MKTALRRVTTQTGSYRKLFYWCQACGRVHGVRVDDGPSIPQPKWSWDGDRERPTLSPSIKESFPADDESPEEIVCHHFVKAGRIEYCGDNPHILNGATVDMVEIPDSYSISGDEA